MPNTLYYFAIGGTGAQSVEPLLHCCAAGIGPARLSLSLIDPDGSNPVFTRAIRLVEAYRDTRAAFGNPTSGFFATELIRAERSHVVWSPVQDGGRTLEEFVDKGRMSPDTRAMFDLLFTPAQQAQQLMEGFRGNPAIGSIMMYGLKDSPYFRELMNGARQDAEARFFAVGSIFGGTGASGLPVLAELLHQEGIETPRLGAAVVTPYYALKNPGASEAGQLAPHSELFLPNTAAALPTYTRERSEYGALYYVGDAGSLSTPRSIYSAGGREQKNDPHVVELYAALAALDFAASPPPRQAAGGNGAGRAHPTRHLYVTVTPLGDDKNPAEYAWEQLPVTDQQRAELITFAVAANFFLQYFGATRTKAREQEIVSELGKLPWLDHIGLRAEFVRLKAAELDALGAYLAAAWEYLWGVSNNSLPFGLVDFGAESTHTIDAPAEYARPHTHRVKKIVLPRVDNCVRRKPPRRRFFGGADTLKVPSDMFGWYNQVNRDEVKDLRGFLAYLHDGTRNFLEEWYNIKKAT